MLDGEVAGVDAFFAEVLYAVEEIATVSHVIDIARFQCFLKLVVGGEPALFALPVERDFEARERLLLLNAVGQAGEDLVEAARLKVADAAAEDVAFEELDALNEFFEREGFGAIVEIIESEDDGRGHFD